VQNRGFISFDAGNYTFYTAKLELCEIGIITQFHWLSYFIGNLHMTNAQEEEKKLRLLKVPLRDTTSQFLKVPSFYQHPAF